MRQRYWIRMSSTLLILALGGCGGPPQIGENKEAFKTVDALYTAVGLRDAKLIAQCEAKLKGLHDAGSLPAGASSSLSSIIAEAKDAKWERSMERLTVFMEGQHR
jgi:hypothetical protein